VRPSGGEAAFVVNCRETAPLGASEEMYVDNPEAARTGVLAGAVPGELMCLEVAHGRAGCVSARGAFGEDSGVCGGFAGVSVVNLWWVGGLEADVWGSQLVCLGLSARMGLMN